MKFRKSLVDDPMAAASSNSTKTYETESNIIIWKTNNIYMTSVHSENLSTQFLAEIPKFLFRRQSHLLHLLSEPSPRVTNCGSAG